MILTDRYLGQSVNVEEVATAVQGAFLEMFLWHKSILGVDKR